MPFSVPVTQNYRFLPGNNIAGGNGALANVTIAGTENIALGHNVLTLNGNGHSNISVGDNSLANNGNGVRNIAIGVLALFSNIAGGNNIGIGFHALRSTISSTNVGIGNNALFDNNTGVSNTAIGDNTGRGIVSGNNNTILGSNVAGLAAGLIDNVILATGQGTIRGRFDGASWLFSSPVRTLGYTVATLPAGTLGDRAFVTDAVAPTFNAALVGGGTDAVPVFRNATAWVSA